MSAYWLGFFTLPGVSAALYLVIRFCFWLDRWAASHGFTCEVKWKRGSADEEDRQYWSYLLSHDLWYERARGPIFTGHWYREKLRYQEPSIALATRWIGFGRVNGPCVMFFRVRDFGPVE